MILRKRAWDVMREDFETIRENATLGEVMNKMRERLREQPEAHLMVVVTELGKLAGVVTAWDVLRAAEDCVLKEDVSNVDEADWDAAFGRACMLCCGTEVRKIMHRDTPMVKPGDPLLLVLNALIESKRSWVVVEEGGRAIGVILIGDLFREITHEMVKVL
ncbi:CBS domain containing protein [Desulfovibrio sp. X2]|uniref:CBS domain-containing protein n=1 Tax=Desulfovibrio sp. X2 TaxID=941449 RepID=UPI0003588B27|nr:CBS domain-containing protein [Desulfovibrio sp. X2]EPR44459.1 CBS domain containing protein [Desulfovibrio sp. X2]